MQPRIDQLQKQLALHAANFKQLNTDYAANCGVATMPASGATYGTAGQ